MYTLARYTSAQQGEVFNSGAKQRIIRMVDVQNDPMVRGPEAVQ